MNSSNNDPNLHPEVAAFLAMDWADKKHVFTLQVAGQRSKESGELEQKPEVIGPWVAKLRERFGGQLVAVGVEQSRGALIHALLSYDFLLIYPLHTNMVARFRQAFIPSGCKDDPLDTDQILEILTKHRESLRPLQPDTEQTRLLGRLVEDRRKVVNLRSSHVEALGAYLKEYFPQFFELVSGNLTSRLAHDLLRKWPTFQDFQKAKPSVMKRFYYGHNIRSAEIIQKVLQIAKSPHALTTDSAIVESGSRISQTHLALIQTLNSHIDQYDARIAEVFAAHPEAKIYAGLPGTGPVMGPRVCAFFGTDRSRYESAENVVSFTGIAPVTKKSGQSRVVYFRVACPKFDRQTFHELARLSLATCQWARNYVDYYTQKDKKFHTIIRALAYKWIRIIFKCWQNRTPYNDDRYMETLKKRGSIFATWHLKQNA